jgi:hypothetical protein
MAKALEQVPESAAMPPGAAAQVTAPTAAAPDIPAAGDGDKTISDVTTIDPHRAQPAGAPIWRRFWRPFWRQWSRRQRLVAGASAGAALVIVLLWALWPAHRKPATAGAPPASPGAMPAPTAIDEVSPMTPDSTPGLGDAAQLVRLGLHDQAITVLQDVRRNYPRSAYANFLLAVAYLDKLWWSDGLKHARVAIQIDPAYRRSPKLAKLFVHSLVSDGFWEKGGAFLMQDMAEVAIPYLEATAQSDRNPRVRARAAQVLASAPLRASASGRGR